MPNLKLLVVFLRENENNWPEKQMRDITRSTEAQATLYTTINIMLL